MYSLQKQTVWEMGVGCLMPLHVLVNKCRGIEWVMLRTEVYHDRMMELEFQVVFIVENEDMKDSLVETAPINQLKNAPS